MFLIYTMDLELDGETAIITASSSGLGRASAIALAREGANVVINGRNEERLENTKEEIEKICRGKVLAVQGDLTNAEDIKRIVEHTVETFGKIDHVVTSAGGPPSGSFLETTDDEWYQAFDLLVMSVVRIVQEAVPHLEEAGGSIVMITSRSVKEALDSLVLSNSVRMSVVGLEKTLSKELAPGIRVNAVLPGSHETSRTEDLVSQAVDRGDFETYEEGLHARGKNIPIGRIGDPMELGDTVAFLCSDRAGNINGQAIVIDGGSGSSTL